MVANRKTCTISLTIGEDKTAGERQSIRSAAALCYFSNRIFVEIRVLASGQFGL